MQIDRCTSRRVTREDMTKVTINANVRGCATKQVRQAGNRGDSKAQQAQDLGLRAHLVAGERATGRQAGVQCGVRRGHEVQDGCRSCVRRHHVRVPPGWWQAVQCSSGALQRRACALSQPAVPHEWVMYRAYVCGP